MTKVKQFERDWVADLFRARGLHHQAASVTNGMEDRDVRRIIDYIDANPTPYLASLIEELNASYAWAIDRLKRGGHYRRVPSQLKGEER